MMAEHIERRYEEDPTCIIDHENGDQKVPSSEEYFPDLSEPDDDDGKVPVKCPIEPMSDVYVQSLNAAKRVLQKKVLVGNILQKLHKSAGGFLDDVERDKVESGRSNPTKMHTLIEILKTKDNIALNTFYKVLEASKYVEAAEKLKKEIASRGHLLTSSLGDCPSEIELDKVSKVVGESWESLLINLGVPVAKTKSLFQDYFGRTQSACFHGLIFWQKGNEPCRPATWSVLLDALEKGAGLKKYADRRRSELLSQETSCQTESLEKTHKVLKEKSVALSLSNLVATIRKLHPILAKVLTEFRRHVSQRLPQSMYDEVRSICQTTIASRAGVSSFDTFDIPLDISEFAEYVIKKHTSTFDVEVIHKIASLLHQPTLTEAIEKYETVMKPLMMTSIAELTDRCEVMPTDQDSPEGTYRLVLKFPDDVNVKDLYKARDYLEKVLHIPDAKLLAFDFGCTLVYFEITCTPDTLKDLPKKFTKHSNQLTAMGISGAFLIDHWVWGADSDDVWYTDDESDHMEVNDQQRFLGNRKRSHLGSVFGGYSEIVPSKKTSHLKESGDRQGTAEEDYCCELPHSPMQCTEEATTQTTEPALQIKDLKKEMLCQFEQLQTYKKVSNSKVTPNNIPPGSQDKNHKLLPMDFLTPLNSRSYGTVVSRTKKPVAAKNFFTGYAIRFEEKLRALYREISTSPWRSWTEEQLQYKTRDLKEKAKNLTEFSSVQNKTPTASGLKEVASRVQFARNQRILAEKLGVTLFRQHRNPLFNALKRWRDGGGSGNHPPTWGCLLDALSQTPGVDPPLVRDLKEKAKHLADFSLLEYKTPSDSGLKKVASKVHFAGDQHIFAENLGVTLSREQFVYWTPDPMLDALREWRDGGGGEDHPPTWGCLLDALSQTPGVDPHFVRDLEEKATHLTELSLDGDFRYIYSSDYHYQTNLRSSKFLALNSSKESSTQSVHRRLTRKAQAIPSSSDTLHDLRWDIERTFITPHTSHISFLSVQPQASSVHSHSTDEVESAQMDQTYGDCREISSSNYHYQTNLRSSKLLKLSSSGKSSTQPVLRRLARKRRNRLKGISSSAQSINCHRCKSQRTIRTSRTSHTYSLPFFAQPQTVHADSTDEVESTGMHQTDSGFSNDQ